MTKNSIVFEMKEVFGIEESTSLTRMEELGIGTMIEVFWKLSIIVPLLVAVAESFTRTYYNVSFKLELMISILLMIMYYTKNRDKEKEPEIKQFLKESITLKGIIVGVIVTVVFTGLVFSVISYGVTIIDKLFSLDVFMNYILEEIITPNLLIAACLYTGILFGIVICIEYNQIIKSLFTDNKECSNDDKENINND